MGTLHREGTHNRFYETFALFVERVFEIFRRRLPNERNIWHDAVTDNFRVISHKDLRVLEQVEYMPRCRAWNGESGTMNAKTMCLGVLSMGEATGYEIKTQLEGPFHHFFQASFGSIYPALGGLLGDGLVSVREASQNGRPDKKIYALTEAGRASLLQELSSVPGPDRVRSAFLAQMVFLELLPKASLRERIAARLAHYEEQLTRLRQIDSERLPPGRRFALGHGLAVYEAGNAYLRDNQQLLAREVRPAASRDAAD